MNNMMNHNRISMNGHIYWRGSTLATVKNTTNILSDTTMNNTNNTHNHKSTDIHISVNTSGS